MMNLRAWRSVRSVMMVTIHVALAAFVIRSSTGPAARANSLPWVALAISVSAFVSWPIGRAVTSAFDPGEAPGGRACPRCGRREIRPLVRPGSGLFEPASGYRCAACWTTFREDGRGWVESEGPTGLDPVDSSGIAYLSDPLGEEEIRFLDEPSDPAEHPGDRRVE